MLNSRLIEKIVTKNQSTSTKKNADKRKELKANNKSELAAKRELNTKRKNNKKKLNIKKEANNKKELDAKKELNAKKDIEAKKDLDAKKKLNSLAQKKQGAVLNSPLEKDFPKFGEDISRAIPEAGKYCRPQQRHIGDLPQRSPT